MSEKLREAVSAAVDDEADEFELRRVLDEVQKDPQLKATWERYQLVGALLRDEHPAVDGSLRERVWAELGTDTDVVAAPFIAEEVQATTTTRSGSRLNRFTGVAVAATVALAVTLIGVNLTDTTTDSAPVIASVQSAPQAAPGAEAATAAPSVGEITDQDEARTAALMLAHAQNLGMNQPGLAAFTKMVTYQSR